jgi:hypothetical protein
MSDRSVDAIFASPFMHGPHHYRLVATALGCIGLALIAACAPTATAPSAPTASTAATAAASPIATIVAAASPVASAIAASSPVATGVAAASPIATNVAAAASPVAASVPVRITGAQLAPGDASITVQNTGSAAAELTGWRLRSGTVTATLPSNTRVPPGDSITIHTASGPSAGRDVYLGGDATALAGGIQPGATLALIDPQGNTVSELVLPR